MVLEIVLPVAQENIPHVARKIREELERLDGERRALVSVLHDIQNSCDHRDGYLRSGTFCCDRCGYSR